MLTLKWKAILLWAPFVACSPTSLTNETLERRWTHSQVVTPDFNILCATHKSGHFEAGRPQYPSRCNGYASFQAYCETRPPSLSNFKLVSRFYCEGQSPFCVTVDRHTEQVVDEEAIKRDQLTSVRCIQEVLHSELSYSSDSGTSYAATAPHELPQGVKTVYAKFWWQGGPSDMSAHAVLYKGAHHWDISSAGAKDFKKLGPGEHQYSIQVDIGPEGGWVYASLAFGNAKLNYTDIPRVVVVSWGYV